FRLLERSDDQGAVGLEQLVDRLQPVPRPGLDALEERVVDADADVDLLGLVLGLALLQRGLVIGHDGEVLGGDPVALGAVAIPAEGDARLSLAVGSEHDGAAEVRRELLLEDSPVDDLDCEESAHAFLPPAQICRITTSSISPRCCRTAASAALASGRWMARRMRRCPSNERFGRPGTCKARERLSRKRSISTSITRSTTLFRAASAIA